MRAALHLALHARRLHSMALLRYFSPSLPKKVSSLTEKEVKEVNAGVAQAQDCGIGPRGKYNAYTAQEKERRSGSMRLNTVLQRLYATVLNSLADRFQRLQHGLRTKKLVSFPSYARTRACAYKLFKSGDTKNKQKKYKKE